MFKRARQTMRLLSTAVILAIAVLVGLALWRHYTQAPWTRDGEVRAQVANIAPQISGAIVKILVKDNEFVRRGEVLYVIEPVDFQISLANAQAVADQRKADLDVKQAQEKRRLELTTLSTSQEEKQDAAGTAAQAQGAYSAALTSVSQARINLQRTEIRSPVNGYVTNLLMRVGDYATSGTSNIQVIDSDSYWIDGYFEETKLAAIHVGDAAQAELMGYHDPVLGHVVSITRGIATPNATAAAQGLPSVNPTYTWVRLAQRIPVRIGIDHVPAGVILAAGMTATVSISAPDADRGALAASHQPAH